MKKKSFNVGDKVFAKIKGYPAWPARVIADSGKKYTVQFYGTGETGIIKSEDLFYYLKHKSQFSKTLKRKDYNEAIEEIEKAIKVAGTDGDTGENDISTTPLSANSSMNEPTEPKKGSKRKRSSSIEKLTADESQPTPKKQGKSRNSTAANNNVTDTPPSQVPDSIIEEVEDNDEAKEVAEYSPAETVSRSGRKIKSKRFLDEEDDVKEKKPARPSKVKTAPAKEDVEEIQKSPEAPPEEPEEEEKEEVEEEVEDEVYEDAEINVPDVKIVADDHLRALIAYANHVRSNETLFKDKAVEKRLHSTNEIVVAKLPSGEYIGIKYNRENAPDFQSEFERAEYDESEAKTILSLKEHIEKGTCKPDDDPNLFVMQLNLDESEIEQATEIKIIERKKAKLKWLKIESSLVELDAKIKACLGLDKAEPKKALEYMNAMLELEVDPLMLKKHPHIIDMVKRIRRYIGNVKEWKLAGDSLETFETDAERVRDKAEDVYLKFKSLFTFNDQKSFWEAFNNKIEEFRTLTLDLKESEVFALCAEPNSRQAFLDRLDDQEEMEMLTYKKPDRPEIKTVNIEVEESTKGDESKPTESV